jgi:hypothetical protein
LHKIDSCTKEKGKEKGKTNWKREGEKKKEKIEKIGYLISYHIMRYTQATKAKLYTATN